MNASLLKKNFLLFLTAVIWGTAFVAQTSGMDHIGPFTFTSLRNFLGAAVLGPIILIRRRRKDPLNSPGASRRALLWGGILCGTVLAAASCLQQIGLQYTTAGKAGFITALYIVLVPLLGLFFKRRVSAFLWISILLSLAGIYLLCLAEPDRMGPGDLLILLCALCFAVHILCVDYFSPRVDGLRLACLQFFVCGLLCLIPMLIWERPSGAQILSARLPLLYAGVLSSGVGYTLQIAGQRNNNPTVASLIMSAESVVSVLAGWLILHQTLSPAELWGCVLVFTALILAQIPIKLPRTFFSRNS